MTDEMSVQLPGGLKAVIRPTPAAVLIQEESFPRRPNDSSPDLKIWEAKRAPSDTKAVRMHLASTYGASCRLCRLPVDMSRPGGAANGPQVDHILPTSRGGSHSWGNLQLVHGACNNLKNDEYAERTLEQYRLNRTEAEVMEGSLAFAIGSAQAYESELEGRVALFSRLAAIGNGRARKTDLDMLTPDERRRMSDALGRSSWLERSTWWAQTQQRKSVPAEWEKVDRRALQLGYPAPARSFDHSMLRELPGLVRARKTVGSWATNEGDTPYVDRRRAGLDAAISGLGEVLHRQATDR